MYRWMILAVTALLSCFSGVVNASAISYSIGNNVLVKNGNKIMFKTPGTAPSLSPSGKMVAFRRRSNIFVANMITGKTVQMTRDHTSAPEKSRFKFQISWSPDEKSLAYTRLLPYRISSDSRTLKAATQSDLRKGEVTWIMTIWVLDLKNKHASQLIGPMGNIRLLSRTSQLDGAAVYEPIYSPNRLHLWFLNAGDLYVARLHSSGGSKAVGVHLVARIGSGLDFQSDGGSSSGSGAFEIAWDAVHKRLYYWLGRFWGTGFSEYGYMTWKSGRLSRPIEWDPAFAPAIEDAWPNVLGCAVDSKGFLWVWHFRRLTQDWVWERYDGHQSLPPETSRPSFQMQRE
ncbi:MAG: DPP IV N-terminal domain-containing protein [Armatimonadetes bacterium]|nr:DPP IV N-terminal domain-containing protein [Armatimonadota bacterium]